MVGHYCQLLSGVRIKNKHIFRTSLLNFIFEPKIDDKKLPLLNEDLSTYLKLNQQSVPSSKYQNKLG